MDTIVLSSFGSLCVVAIVVKTFSKSDSKDDSACGGIEDFSDEAKYKRLKMKFFAAYFLALFGDWLQGPYVYQLYASYGYAENVIGKNKTTVSCAQDRKTRNSLPRNFFVKSI